MRILGYIVIFITTILFATSCSNSNENTSKQKNDSLETVKTLFELTNSAETGFDFTNNIQETDQNNYLTYEYMYNGGGIAVGDINNDDLPDIFIISNFGSNALFLNKGDFKFENITETSGLSSTGLSTGATMADVNGDGLIDIFVCQSFTSNPDERRNKLYINQGNNTFVNEAAAYGLDDPSFSNQACFFDYDLDGDLDMFLVNHRVDFSAALIVNKVEYLKLNKDNEQFLKEFEYTTSKLFKNNGNNTFTDVTKKAGVGGYNYSLSASIADFNKDGYPDIYVANDFGDVDNYYLNNKNGTFSDNLTSSFSHISKNSMGTDASDFNNDGLIDLISLDMLAEDNFRQKQLKGPSPYDKYYLAVEHGLHHQVMRNNLQLNNGDGSFTEIGALSGISHTDWSWAPIFNDFDNDGWKDLFISNGYYRDATDMDYIKYTSPDAIQEAGGFDKVNKLDLLSKMPKHQVSNYIFKNNGDLSFMNMQKEWGIVHQVNSQGAASADLDNDGDLDIIINNLGAPAFIYKNTLESSPEHHYLKIRLKGSNKNSIGIGAKIWISTAGGLQYAEQIPNRGFLSTSEPVIHFGLGKISSIDKLEILWPDGTGQVLENVKADQTLTILQKDATKGAVKIPSTKIDQTIFTKVQTKGLEQYKHQESVFNDFKTDPLIPHMLSDKGPHIEKGDLNKDGLEDLVVSGSAGYSTEVYLQKKDRSFVKVVQTDLDSDSKFEDSDLALADFDNDGDLDLYIPSGSSEFSPGSAELQDRLYINDGKGVFKRNEAFVPRETETATCAIPVDYDGDGLMDLFVGASSSARFYPVSSKCLLLHNIGAGFKNRSDLLPKNGSLGMINDAEFADVTGDGKPDLIIAGEWSPIRVFSWTGTKMVEQTQSLGLEHTSGWWNCLESADIDGDGDIDLVAGNRGLNSFYKASPDKPAQIYYADFDNNGSIDPFQFYYFNDGKTYPRHTLEETFSQMPSIRKRFLRFTPYANATLSEFFTPEQKQSASILQAEMFESIALYNEGGKFRLIKLPNMTQTAPVNCIRLSDFDMDGLPDILLVGNQYNVDAETGRYDAMHGVFIKRIKVNDSYEAIPGRISGFNTFGDCREMTILNTPDNKRLIIVTTNQGTLQSFELKK